MTDALAGQRVTVMGLGTRRGGVGVARFLAEHDAIVTVTDGKPASDLTASIEDLAGLPIRYVLGGHDDCDFTSEGADIVIRNPGVRRDSRYLELARSSGVRVEMEMSLFFRLCPGLTIGITGTKGKTTTSTLCGLMLSAWKPETVLAGNMGVSALAQLERIGPETPVVIEISNWQLEALDEHRLGPRIAVLTNISEDHLNTYDGFDDYANTKRSIATHLSPSDFLILNHDDSEVQKARELTIAQLVPFGTTDPGGDGVWYDDEKLTIREDGDLTSIPFPPRLIAGGRHLLANAAAATAAARRAGAPFEAIAKGLDAFTGVKDRNELVATIDGVDYINDTASTSPIATIVALETHAGRPIHLITGGADKQLPLGPLASAAARGAECIYLLNGSATGPLRADLIRLGAQPVGPFDSMHDVIEAAIRNAKPGDIVLLSPGCASFGIFRDEFDRGEQFRQEVQGLAAANRVGR